MTEVRPKIVGPDAGPEPPFPVCVEGKVIPGFGRGGKQLNCPTANLDLSSPGAAAAIDSIPFGVYYGWAALRLPPTHPDAQSPSVKASTAEAADPKNPFADPRYPAILGKWFVYPMVMSLGKNPFFQNETRSLEVHVLHSFTQDFYEEGLRVMIMGYIRAEKNYDSLEGLVQDIRTDCEVARRCLTRTGYALRELGEGGTADGSWLVRGDEEEKN